MTALHEQKYTSTAPLTLRNYTIKLNQKRKKEKGIYQGTLVWE